MNKSNKWAYGIEFKKNLSTDGSKDKVLNLCKIIRKEMSKLIKTLDKSTRFCEEDKDYFLNELTEIEHNFEFLEQLCDGTIPKDNWHEYSFEGDFSEWLNEYLTDLYDLADSRIADKFRKTSYKFLWIN